LTARRQPGWHTMLPAPEQAAR